MLMQQGLYSVGGGMRGSSFISSKQAKTERRRRGDEKFR